LRGMRRAAMVAARFCPCTCQSAAETYDMCDTHTHCGGALFCWLSEVCWHPPSPFCWAGEEIWQQTGGQLDAFVSGAGTGGTIAGVSLQLKSHNPAVKVVLADPQGSSLFNKVSVINLRASKIYGSIKPGDEQNLPAYPSSCGAPPDINLSPKCWPVSSVSAASFVSWCFLLYSHS